MSELPILFSGPMVRAILAGTKTQTRRVVKPRKDRDIGCELAPSELAGEVNAGIYRNCPYGQPGDRLWVRETWAYGIHAMAAKRDEAGPFVYAADGTPQGRLCDRWRPSIHMPRSACRIRLEITDVRVEHLQDITEANAKAEGYAPAWLDADDNTTVHAEAPPTYRRGFARLWRDINGPDAWEANPWVWVVEFRRMEP